MTTIVALEDEFIKVLAAVWTEPNRRTNAAIDAVQIQRREILAASRAVKSNNVRNRTRYKDDAKSNYSETPKPVGKPDELNADNGTGEHGSADAANDEDSSSSTPKQIVHRRLCVLRGLA